jgi:hypothetical protein
MRFHVVIFITLMGFESGTHGAFGWIWGYTPSPLLFLIVDYLMEIFVGGDSLLYDGWSWLMIM